MFSGDLILCIAGKQQGAHKHELRFYIQLGMRILHLALAHGLRNEAIKQQSK